MLTVNWDLVLLGQDEKADEPEYETAIAAAMPEISSHHVDDDCEVCLGDSALSVFISATIRRKKRTMYWSEWNHSYESDGERPHVYRRAFPPHLTPGDIVASVKQMLMAPADPEGGETTGSN